MLLVKRHKLKRAPVKTLKFLNHILNDSNIVTNRNSKRNSKTWIKWFFSILGSLSTEGERIWIVGTGSIQVERILHFYGRFLVLASGVDRIDTCAMYDVSIISSLNHSYTLYKDSCLKYTVDSRRIYCSRTSYRCSVPLPWSLLITT